MTIQLSPEQQQWLEAQVAAGNFSSLEEAVAVAIADLMATTEDDLDWAKPLVDEAIASVERGEDIPADEAWERILRPFDR